MNLKKRFDPNHDIRFGQAQGPVISAQIWKGNGPKPVRSQETIRPSKSLRSPTFADDEPAEQGERNRTQHEDPRHHQTGVRRGMVKHNAGDHRTERSAHGTGGTHPGQSFGQRLFRHGLLHHQIAGSEHRRNRKARQAPRRIPSAPDCRDRRESPRIRWSSTQGT